MATPDKSVELQNVTNDNSSNRISVKNGWPLQFVA